MVYTRILLVAAFNIFFLVEEPTQRTKVQLEVFLGAYLNNVTKKHWMAYRYRSSPSQIEMFSFVVKIPYIWVLTFRSENTVEWCNLLHYRGEQRKAKFCGLRASSPGQFWWQTNKHLLWDQYREIVTLLIHCHSEQKIPQFTANFF